MTYCTNVSLEHLCRSYGVSISGGFLETNVKELIADI